LPMKLCIHRGAQQIGGSCVELESQGQRLLLDLGLPLESEENSPEFLPKVSGLLESDPTLLGVLVSHPHMDHYGLLGHVRPELPVAMGAAARRILEAAAPWVPGAVVPAPGPVLEDRKTFVLGPFQVTPFLVDHSAYDSYALLVEADGKRIFYSGDFRAHGRKGKLYDRMITHPPAGIDVLIMEGSSLGRIGLDTTFETEDELEARLVAEIQAAEGLALVYASAQNIDRVVTVFRAAKRSGRRLVIDLYNAAILEATGKDSIPQSYWPQVALFIPQYQRIQIKENARFDLLRQHSAHRIYQEDLAADPGAYALMFRPVHQRDLERAGALGGARFIYSMWEGYLDEGSGARVKLWAERLGIPFTRIHTSGHAGPADLKRFAQALAPKVVVPIHSFHPGSFPDLFPNVEPHGDGDWWDLGEPGKP
jgi:ribonuclease J